MARIYLGSATTNSNGVASLSYTATGKGKLNVVAHSGALASDGVPVVDCVMIDALTDPNDEHTRWRKTNNDLYMTTTSDGTKMGTESSGGYWVVAPNGNSSSTMSNYNLFNEWCMEFDIVELVTAESGSTGHFSVFLADTDVHGARLGTQLGIPNGSTGHCKIWYDGTNVFSQLGDGEPYESTTSSTQGQFSTMRVGFSINNSSCYMKFKNFKIYPI